MKYVYIIQSLENGCFKIGVSKNPEYRLKQLQTANSSKLKLIISYSSEHAYNIEKYLHNIYSHSKKEGEWFDISLTEAYLMTEKCQKFEENITFLKKNGNVFI